MQKEYNKINKFAYRVTFQRTYDTTTELRCDMSRPFTSHQLHNNHHTHAVNILRYDIWFWFALLGYEEYEV